MASETLTMRAQHAAHRLFAAAGYGITRIPALKNGIPSATTPLECAELYKWTKACEKIPGELAEVGVYLGGTAAVMLQASGKRLHLFDTFAGLPDSENQFEKGEYEGTIENVKRNLAPWAPRVEYHQGLFPASAADLSLTFSFVHLDMDLFEGTKAALEWFWPRLSAGGAILSHDYPLSEGVVRAFDQFFADRPESFFPLAGSQCVTVKSMMAAVDR